MHGEVNSRECARDNALRFSTKDQGEHGGVFQEGGSKQVRQAWAANVKSAIQWLLVMVSGCHGVGSVGLFGAKCCAFLQLLVWPNPLQFFFAVHKDA